MNAQPLLYPRVDNRPLDDYLPINDAVMSSLLKSIVSTNKDQIAQAHAVVGQIGSGKTTLINRLVKEIKDNYPDFYPIAIDATTLFTIDEIWMQCAECNSFDNVQNWQQEHNQRIVLFIDNIQYLFNRLDEAQKFSLRGKLNSARAPMLIATSNTVLSDYTDYKSAFFDGLKISYLRPLNIDEVSSLCFSEKELSRATNLLEYLPKTVRSLLLIKQLIKLSQRKTEDINFLMDYFAPIYQMQFDTLSGQMQRIALALSSGDGRFSLQNIRELTGQDGSTISPYLKKMVDMGMVNKESTSQRTSTYQLNNPLFRRWLGGIIG